MKMQDVHCLESELNKKGIFVSPSGLKQCTELFRWLIPPAKICRPPGLKPTAKIATQKLAWNKDLLFKLIQVNHSNLPSSNSAQLFPTPTQLTSPQAALLNLCRRASRRLCGELRRIALRLRSPRESAKWRSRSCQANDTCRSRTTVPECE